MSESLVDLVDQLGSSESMPVAKLRALLNGKILENLPTEYKDCIEQNNGKTAYGYCGRVTGSLFDELQERGMDFVIATSDNYDTSGHVYLRRISDDVIIDGTAGQFIEGFKSIFVGKREELKNLVLAEQTKIINTRSKNNPQEAFERNR